MLYLRWKPSGQYWGPGCSWKVKVTRLCWNAFGQELYIRHLEDLKLYLENLASDLRNFRGKKSNNNKAYYIFEQLSIT